MHYPISFALQVGPAALGNSEAFREVVRIVLEEVKAAGMDCPVTVAPATVAPATVAPTAPRGPWELNYRAALQCVLRLTREQNAIWIVSPPKMQSAIREAIAQICCEHGKENGVLRPVLTLTAESESGFKIELPEDTAAADTADNGEWEEPPCELENIDTAALFE